MLWPRLAATATAHCWKRVRRWGVERAVRCAVSRTARAPCVQQAAQIHIAAFADATQIATVAGRRLARCQAKPAGKLSSSPKRLNVIHRSDKSGRGQDADAGNLLESARNGMLAGDPRELPIDAGDPRVEA